MKNIKRNILIAIFIILVVVSIVIINYQNNKNFIYTPVESSSLKHYEENEYIPVNISYDQIARIYLQDYVYKLLNDRQAAYDLLDKEYREKRFTSFDSFNKYIDIINTMRFREMKVKDYAITENGSIREFDVHDSDGNLFIFREKGVMQYTVFFDRNTVNMK